MSGNAMVGYASVDDVRATFATPWPVFRPMVRWWWPGGNVEDSELRRELRILQEAGFGGVEIQPFSIGLGPDAPIRVHDYATPSFWARVRAALEEVRTRGMWLDLTLGSGWPFGGAHIDLRHATKELRFTHQTVSGPARFGGKIERPVFLKHWEPDAIDVVLGWRRPSAEEREAMLHEQKVVAVLALRGSATDAKPVGAAPRFGQQRYEVRKPGQLDRRSAVVLTDRVGEDGSLAWDVPEGEWQLFVFAENPADKTVLGGVGGHPQRVLDHLDPTAMQIHLDAVGGSAHRIFGEFFGNGLRAVFCDSLEVEADLFWTGAFPGEFQRRRGYDLVPWLPFLKQPGRGENYTTYPSLPFYEDIDGEAEGVRYDYWLTVSELLQEAFYGPFCDWAAQHGVLARVQAHGAQADVMAIYGRADIPETETLAHNGRADFIKMAASAAHQSGSGLATAECFVHAGNPHMITPEAMKHEADQLFLAGINQLIYHGYAYDTKVRDGSPWHPFVAPLPFTAALNQHSPFWRFLRPFNDYVARVQMLLQSGRTAVPVAIFATEFSCEDSERLGTMAQREEIVKRLMERGYACDRISSGNLRRGALLNRQLEVGAAAYTAIIAITEGRVACEDAEALAALARGGLTVVLLGRGSVIEAGHLDHRARTARIRAALAELECAVDTEAAVAAVARRVVPNLRIDGSVDNIAFLEKRIGDRAFFFFRNETDAVRKLDVVLPRRTGVIERWDAWTGAITEEANWGRARDGVRLWLTLAPNEMRIVGCEDGRVVAPAAARSIESALTIPGPWALTAGRLVRQSTSLFDWAEDTELCSFSGTAVYATKWHLPDGLVTAGERLQLDLGEVRDVAEVRVNGRDAPPLLFAPYVLDITDWVRPGFNEIEIGVTNSSTNAYLASGVDLVGIFRDESEHKPLRSGLIGPVRLQVVRGRDLLGL